MTEHSFIAEGEIHAPFQWSYADETEREAATGFTASDLYKFALQLSDHSVWILTDDSPVTWVAVDNSGDSGGIPDSGWIDKTAQTWTRRSQAYTNDPAAGSNIALNMADTQGFLIGDTVTVSSSAGSESARVVGVTANTSITVDALALNHTTSSPLVTHLNCFTVSTDLTADYRKGTKIRYKDGGSYKYGVVKSSSYVSVTAVTMTPNTDYTIGASAITDNYASYIEDPESWPDWFNYSPLINCNGSMTFTSVTTNFAKWRQISKTLHVIAKATGTIGGSASTAIQFSLPANAALAANSPVGSALVVDGGATIVGRCFVSDLSPDAVVAGKSDATNWGTGAGRVANVSILYEME